VPSGSSLPKTTAQKAKDAINDALKSNSELQDKLLESGRKLAETEERITSEQKDTDQLTSKKLQEAEGAGRRRRIKLIFGIVIAGLVSLLFYGLLSKRGKGALSFAKRA
jgi:hypothetical protein